MAKQRGGSPFTDSWFEMPFWFLFFLLIIIITLLWQFGIFTKSVTTRPPLPPTLRPTAKPTTLYAVDVSDSYFGPPFGIGPERFSYMVLIHFVRWNDPTAVLNAQVVSDGVAGTLHQIHWEDSRYTPPEFVQRYPKGTSIPKTVSVNAYLSVNDVAVTPISSFVVPSSFPHSTPTLKEMFSLY